MENLLCAHPDNRLATTLRSVQQEARAQEVLRRRGLVSNNLFGLSLLSVRRLLLRIVQMDNHNGPLSADLWNDLRFLVTHLRLEKRFLGQLLADVFLQRCDLAGLAVLLDEERCRSQSDATTLLRRCVNFCRVALSQPIDATAIERRHFDRHLELAFWSAQRLLTQIEEDDDYVKVRWERAELHELCRALEAQRVLRSHFGVTLPLDLLECGGSVARTKVVIAAMLQLDRPLASLRELLLMTHVLYVSSEALRAACVEQLLHSCSSSRVEDALLLATEWLLESGNVACEPWCLELLCVTLRQLEGYIDDILEKALPTDMLDNIAMIVRAIAQQCPPSEYFPVATYVSRLFNAV